VPKAEIKDLSPRLITVASPSVELSIQDLVDTLREAEHDHENLGFPRLIDAAGKEPLGGGVLVGITATLNNSLVAFEARSGPGWILCTISGGNLVAVDGIGGLIDPRSPTAFTTVDRALSSSATLLDLESLQASQAASFSDGAVAVDVSSSFTGTEFPVGIREFPVNNMTDALAIANNRGLNRFRILSTMTLSSGDFSAGYVFSGDSIITTNLILEAAANVANCEFENFHLEGTIDGSVVVRACEIDDLIGFNGHMIDSFLHGTITLGGGMLAEFYNCSSGVAGGGNGQTANIDMGGSGQDMLVRNYSGGLSLSNLTTVEDVSLDFLSGRLIVDATVTASTITVRGSADVADNSTGTANVQDLTINKRMDQLVDDLENRLVTVDNGNGTGTMTLYADDGITVLKSWTTVIEGSGAISERLPV